MARVRAAGEGGALQGPGPGEAFELFISYRRVPDSPLATKLSRSIERLGTPWWKPRARRVYVDRAVGTPGESLRVNLETALNRSNAFLLLACQESSRSQIVDDEVAWWLQHRSGKQLFLAVTEPRASGEGPITLEEIVRWLPPSLTFESGDPPAWVDLSWAAHGAALDPKDRRLEDATAEILGGIHGRPKDEFLGAEVSARRRARLVARTGISTLTALVLILALVSILTVRQRNDAVRTNFRITAESMMREAQDVRDTDPDYARELLLTAYPPAPE